MESGTRRSHDREIIPYVFPEGRRVASKNKFRFYGLHSAPLSCYFIGTHRDPIIKSYLNPF